MVKTPKKLAPSGKAAKPSAKVSPKPAKAKPVLKSKRKPLKAKLIQRVVSRVAADSSRTAIVLDRLYSVIDSRRDADPTLSHSARLLARGPAKVAQKFGEEAVEALIECVEVNKPALIAESADVLYHLLLMWVSCGIAPAEVWAELERREGVSGIVEKASRPLPRDVVTRKIP